MLSFVTCLLKKRPWSQSKRQRLKCHIWLRAPGTEGRLLQRLPRLWAPGGRWDERGGGGLSQWPACPRGLCSGAPSPASAHGPHRCPSRTARVGAAAAASSGLPLARSHSPGEQEPHAGAGVYTSAKEICFRTWFLTSSPEFKRPSGWIHVIMETSEWSVTAASFLLCWDPG